MERSEFEVLLGRFWRSAARDGVRRVAIDVMPSTTGVCYDETLAVFDEQAQCIAELEATNAELEEQLKLQDEKEISWMDS